MKRVATASFVGSAIEYYDFYIYGTAAALVFPKVFFPHLGTTMATVASMATFAAAFLSASARRGVLRALRRPARPQVDPDRHLADHGPVHR